MNSLSFRHVHFVGVGGISMSAVAKILLAQGASVSGSDVVENEQTKILTERGMTFFLGESPEHVPPQTDLVVYTSAAPEKNLERVAARDRGILQMTNFQFLGERFAEAETYLVAGTHGKSTTTAILGLLMERQGLDPTVFVGSLVPGFVDGNLRIGKPDVLVIEGDEYARHFLEFRPTGLILNNLEWDHPDVFPTFEEMVDAFRECLRRVRPNGTVVANVGSEAVARLIEEEQALLAERKIEVVRFHLVGENPHASGWRVESEPTEGSQFVVLRNGDEKHAWNMRIPGRFNALNAAAAYLLVRKAGVEERTMQAVAENFAGIWRRFELLGDVRGARVYSDYGHHPTAVSETLRAAREMFPSSRLVLVFQPHHRNRTRNLFFEFIPSFDLAQELILCEIYDVPGREDEGESVSSQDLVDAIHRHDAERGANRDVLFAPDPESSLSALDAKIQPGDVVIIMGAGKIDSVARAWMKTVLV